MIVELPRVRINIAVLVELGDVPTASAPMQLALTLDAKDLNPNDLAREVRNAVEIAVVKQFGGHTFHR